MRPTETTRPSSRRGASGAWNRLKPVRDDALESYGLPSKGEIRLNDFRIQESYYNRIVERYMKFCAASNSGDDLDQQFASLSIDSTPSLIAPTSLSTALPVPALRSLSPVVGELSTILLALRKLREALTATSRRDLFAQRVYIFNIHAAILCKDWESYAPALTTLLNTIHPRAPLTAAELHEYTGYLVLDIACRKGEFAEAYEAKSRWKYKDRRVELVLKALVNDNWTVFWKMRRSVDGYQRRLMQFAEQGVRLHALKCLGRGYMNADKAYIERCADRKWSDLVNDGVGWELVDGDKVVIKKPKEK